MNWRYRHLIVRICSWTDSSHHVDYPFQRAWSCNEELYEWRTKPTWEHATLAICDSSTRYARIGNEKPKINWHHRSTLAHPVPPSDRVQSQCGGWAPDPLEPFNTFIKMFSIFQQYFFNIFQYSIVTSDYGVPLGIAPRVVPQKSSDVNGGILFRQMHFAMKIWDDGPIPLRQLQKCKQFRKECYMRLPTPDLLAC